MLNAELWKRLPRRLTAARNDKHCGCPSVIASEAKQSHPTHV